MSEYLLDDLDAPEPNVRHQKLLVIGLMMMMLVPLSAVLVMVDFDRWQGQWRVWWGLTLAEETTRTPAEIADVYSQGGDWFVRYEYTGFNEFGGPQRVASTEKVGLSTLEKIEAGEQVMVDYVVGDPQVGGLETNHNPFTRFGAWLVLGGAAALQLLRNGSPRSRREVSVVRRLAEKSRSETMPDWLESSSSYENKKRIRSF